MIEQIPEPPAEQQALASAGPLQEYPTEAAAQAALESKEISKYYIVPADFIESGDLIVVDSNFSVFNSLENNDYFEYVLRLNLVKDANLAEMLDDPTAKVKTQALAPQGVQEDDGFELVRRAVCRVDDLLSGDHDDGRLHAAKRDEGKRESHHRSAAAQPAPARFDAGQDSGAGRGGAAADRGVGRRHVDLFGGVR